MHDWGRVPFKHWDEDELIHMRLIQLVSLIT